MRRLLLCLALALGVASVPAAANPLLIVGNKGEDSISFVDLVTGRELARRETGPNPHEIALSPDGKRIAVVAYGGSSIDIFDVERRERVRTCLLYTSPSPRDVEESRMPSSA